MKLAARIILFLIMKGWAMAAGAEGRIYFCEKYTPAGDPIGTSNVWTIPPEGGNVYVLYRQHDKITVSGIYVLIDKLSGNNYVQYGEKIVYPEKDKSWTILDYTFKEAGEYKFRFLDGPNQEMATEYVTVRGADQIVQTNSANTIRSNKPLSPAAIPPDYYAKARLLFCSSVTNGQPKGVGKNFGISKKGGWVQVYIDNPLPLSTGTVVVDIFRRKEADYTFLESKNIPVQPDTKAINFKYVFLKPGEYRFTVYSKENKLIRDGYVKISERN